MPARLVSAAESTRDDLFMKIDYETFQATLKTNGNDKYLFLEVLKENKDDAKISATYQYKTMILEDENTNGFYRGVIIDLSFLKATANQYVRIYGDTSAAKSKIYSVGAQPGK